MCKRYVVLLGKRVARVVYHEVMIERRNGFFHAQFPGLAEIVSSDVREAVRFMENRKVASQIIKGFNAERVSHKAAQRIFTSHFRIEHQKDEPSSSSAKIQMEV